MPKVETAAFDLDDLAATDQAELEIKSRDGRPTGWKWTIAGPGHPKTIEIANRLSKDNFARSKAQEMARVNGKKWKGDDETPDEALQRTAETLAGRVLGWTPVSFGGQPFPFSPENVVKLLLDPDRGDTLVNQLSDFYGDEKSFMKRSVKP
jgi:hypothetical protein